MARARRHAVEVHAVWDSDAEVWSAEAENLPALHVEAGPFQRPLAALIGFLEIDDRDGGFGHGARFSG